VTGLNEPNIMTPGAWVIIGLVSACVLAGFLWMFFTYWFKVRVPWSSLAGYYSAKFYEEPGNPNFSGARLVAALRKCEELLLKHTKYTAVQLATCFQRIHIFVKKDNAWVDQWGRKVAGEEGGKVIAVGADLAALLHEEGHLLEEMIDLIVDDNHTTWPAKGFDVADVEYQAWLKMVP